MTYHQTLEYLYNRLPVFHHIGSSAYKPGLTNTIRLMEALGNPYRKYHTIHVAGTNGKGSVSHFLAAILQKAGYKTGLYTSPHLVDFGERIKVNGQMIDQHFVIDFVEQRKTLFDDIEPSFFEATMAMAFDYFAAQQVDVAIVEVGLGGRLDSTNVIEPDLSIITNISFDHVGFLGDTLAKIAYEKAGIIKPNTPVIIGEALSETRPIFEQKAAEMNAHIIFAEEQYQVHPNKEQYSSANKMFVDIKCEEKIKLKNPVAIGLLGNYQLKNTATVLSAVAQLNNLIKKENFPPTPLTIDGLISEEIIRGGLENVVEITGLQGRWQILQQQPTVIIDTGHNEAGIRQVVEQLQHQQYETLHIVIGMVNDKDISSVLKLLPKNAVYYFTQAAVARALSAQEFQQQAQRFGLQGSSFSNTKDAVTAALKQSKEDDLVFIGGSNFVVGEVLENWETLSVRDFTT